MLSCKEGWEVVSGSRRSGEMFNDEVAHGRGGERWLRHATEDTKSDDRGKGGGKGGAAELILLSTNAEMKW